VPFVPTKSRHVKYIAELADLKKGEKVFDLGCGDGRFLTEAYKKTGTQATGFENAPIPYLLAKLRKLLTGADINVSIKNFLHEDLSRANVIYCYLGPETMQKLAPKFIKECGKGTRIYSNSFKIDSMKPAKVWEKDPVKHLPKVYLYTV
jgi:16S rRNA A1518/A1519 N6-dimethyltransferase RsmA/KsgA/DIM1 with predicted DNA glycosylase/AP lyase activity